MNRKKLEIKFEWDHGNKTKNWIKHKISVEETEESFYDSDAVVSDDENHSEKIEVRYILIGKTKKGKILYTAFTLREDRIRPISSRLTNKKEVKIYEKKINSSKV
ncbi:MAG TPA: BrnT family toxin [Candidatus Saccharimonadales bacterium]|nr:BrnT family toxin [Candidatus Saccharimonadales bacterium]